MRKVYIIKNYIDGWKVVLDRKHVDCSKPIYHSHNTSEYGLSLCKRYCVDNGLKIIRECR